MALDMLSILRHNSDDFYEVLDEAEYSIEEINEAIRAQQELSEVTKLVDVVKGFIEDNELCDEEALYYTVSKNPDKAYDIISRLCNIVGYKD